MNILHSQKLNSFLSSFTPYIPYSYLWSLRTSLGRSKTILDVGCGDGLLMERLIEGRNWQVVGVDIFGPSVKKARGRSIYEKTLKGDVLDLLEKMRKRKEKYDTVFCSQVLEHISKPEGKKLLSLMEDLAKKRVVVATPQGFMEQPKVFIGDNPYQYHKSGWQPRELRERGYRVYGLGFKVSWSEKGINRKANNLVAPIFGLISFLLSPLVYYYPSLGAGMLCIKDKEW